MSNDSSKKQTPERPESNSLREESQVHWGPTSAILYTFFLYFGGQFFAGLALAVLVATTGLSGDSMQKISGQFYFVIFSDALMILGLWLFLRTRRNSFSQLGFGRRPAVRDIGYALVGYAMYFIAFFIIAAFIAPMIGVNTEQRQELGFDNLLTQAEKIMGLLALVLLPPFIEETIFRGFLFTGLRKKMTFVWAAVITSIFFASPHLLASSDGLLWVAGIDTFILSLVLCYLRERTGALWAPIAVHAIKNAIAFSILLSGVAWIH